MVEVHPYVGVVTRANFTGNGPWLVIQGTNLGFQNDSVTVTVDAVSCTDAYVTVADVEIQCQLGTIDGSGTGSAAGYNVTATLANGLIATLTNGFKYLQPNVTSVTGDLDFNGDQVVSINGTRQPP
eukprot:9490709-Pyramimonas_sp.AAC.1